MLFCPNINSKEWKDFESTVGDFNIAVSIWRGNDNRIPDAATTQAKLEELRTREGLAQTYKVAGETYMKLVEAESQQKEEGEEREEAPAPSSILLEKYLLDPTEANYAGIAEAFKLSNFSEQFIFEQVMESDNPWEDLDIFLGSENLDVNEGNLKRAIAAGLNTRRFLNKIEEGSGELSLYGQSLDSGTWKEMVDGISFFLLRGVRGNNFGLAQTPENLFRATVDKDFRLTALRNAVAYSMLIIQEKADDYVSQQMEAIMNSFLADPREMMEEIYPHVGLRMEKGKLPGTFEDPEEMEENMEFMSYEDTNLPETVYIDPRDKESEALKLLLSSVPRHNNQMSVYQSPQYGLPALTDKGVIANIIINTLAGQNPESENAIRLLNEKANESIEIRSLMNKLNSQDFSSNIAEIAGMNRPLMKDVQTETFKSKLLTELLSHYTLTKHNFFDLKFNPHSGKVFFDNLNDRTHKREIKNEWKSATDIAEVDEKFREKFLAGDNVKMSSVTLKNTLGIEIPDSVLNETWPTDPNLTLAQITTDAVIKFRKHLKEHPTLSMSDIYDSSEIGLNPFDYLAKRVAKQNLAAKQHFVAHQKLIHPANLHSSYSIIMDTISSIQQEYKNDPQGFVNRVRQSLPFLYTDQNNHSIILQNLKNPHRDIEYANVYGINSYGNYVPFRKMSGADIFHTNTLATLNGFLVGLKHGDRPMKYDMRFRNGQPLLESDTVDGTADAAMDYFTEVLRVNEKYGYEDPVLDEKVPKEDRGDERKVAQRLTEWFNSVVSQDIVYATENGLMLEKLYPTDLIEKHKVGQEDVNTTINRMLTISALNQLVSTYDQQLFITGRFSQYESASKFSKIANGISSTGELFMDSKEIEDTINSIEKLYELPDGSTFKTKKYLNEATFKTKPETIQSVIDTVTQAGLSKDLINSYRNIDVPDGIAMLNPVTYFHLRVRRGQVSPKELRTYKLMRTVLQGIMEGKSQDELREISRTTIDEILGGIPKNEIPKGKTSEIYKTLFSRWSFEKLQMFGPQYNEEPALDNTDVPFEMALLKAGFQVANPLEAIDNKEMYDLIKFMFDNDVDIYTHETGKKTGAYPKDLFDLPVNKLIDLKFLKTQIQMPEDAKEESRLSTQGLALLSSGIPDSPIARQYEQNIAADVMDKTDRIKKLTERHSVFTQQLTRHSRNSGHPSNVVNSFRAFTPSQYFVESLPSSKLFDATKNAFLRKSVINQYRKGISMYQVANTFRNDLDWYRYDSEGNLLPAEVIIPLPWELVDAIGRILKTDNLQTILDFANTNGYQFEFWSSRIPGQSKSSMDWYKVAKFSSPLLQNQVVVPKATIAKNGSDFDGDKAYNYFPVFDKNGRVDTNHVNNKLFHQMEIELIKHPDSHHLLFEPVNDELLKKATKKHLSESDRRSLDELSFSQLLVPSDNAEKSWVFMATKEGVGIAANSIKATKIAQRYNLELNDNIVNEKGIIIPQKLPFRNTQLKLDMQSNVQNRSIEGEQSMILTSQVDGIKNPYAPSLGLYGTGLAVGSYLSQRGVDLNTIAAFLTQPIIQDYIKNSLRASSPISKAFRFHKDTGRNELGVYSRSKSAAYLKGKYKSTDGFRPLMDLDENTLIEMKNKVSHQAQLLNLFMMLEDMTNAASDFLRFAAGDTTRFKSFAEVRQFYEILMPKLSNPNYNPIKNPYALNTNTISGAFAEARKLFYEPFISWHIGTHPEGARLLKAITEPYINEFTPAKLQADYMKTAELLLAQYIIQNSNSDLKNKFSKYIREAGTILNNIKNNPVHPMYNNLLVKSLSVTTFEGFRSIKLDSRATTSIDADPLTKAALELRSFYQKAEEMGINEPNLYKALVNLTPFLPYATSGLFDLNPILPYEDLLAHHKVVREALEARAVDNAVIPTVQQAHNKMLSANTFNKPFTSDFQESKMVIKDRSGRQIATRYGFTYANLQADRNIHYVADELTQSANKAISSIQELTAINSRIKDAVIDTYENDKDVLGEHSVTEHAASVMRLKGMQTDEIIKAIKDRGHTKSKSLGVYSYVADTMEEVATFQEGVYKTLSRTLPNKTDLKTQPELMLEFLRAHGVVTWNPRSSNYEISGTIGGTSRALGPVGTNEDAYKNFMKFDPIGYNNMRTVVRLSSQVPGVLSLQYTGKSIVAIPATIANRDNTVALEDMNKRCVKV